MQLPVALLALTGLALVTSAPASAQATFTVEGPAGASRLAPDGQTVVGSNANGAYLWTESGGFVSIGGESGVDLADDASAVVGNRSGADGFDGPARWDAQTGWVDLGGLPGQVPPGGSHGSAYAVSGDGSVVVGLGWLSNFRARGFRWDAVQGMVELPHMGAATNSSRASAISGDGQWIGGFDEHSSGTRRAALWDANLNETLLLARPANPEGFGEINDINADGSVMCGIDSQFGEGYVWRNGEVTTFGVTPGFEGLPSYNFANAVSGDGSVAVGGVWDLLGNTTFATIWREGAGQSLLSEYLISQGVTGLDQIQLANCLDISEDGSTIIGWGVQFPFSFVWWRATLPTCEGGIASFCITSPNSVGAGAWMGSNGNVSISAAALELQATPVPDQPGLFYFGAATQQTAFGDGFQCIAGPPLYRLPLEQAVGGMLQHALDFDSLPAGTLVPGSTWHFQAWYRDPAAAGAGFNFSDALSVTFCD